LGQESSEADITKILEERWYTPLKMIHVSRPMENNQVLHFTRRAMDDDEEEERNIGKPTDPLQMSRDLSN
jgi:hypothetical protein